jgi:hypothetical protein
MRAAFFAAALLMFAAGGAEAVEFPYTAYVNSPDVYVRSGPGKNYYPTDKLQPGEQIEVYRHDPGGWCAIRPPQNSFSWVSAKSLKPGKEGLGTVTADRVVARVGSAFSDIRESIQVRLDRGEKVEILDSQTLSGESWYKIAPPSGEFRWLHVKYLDRRPPRESAAKDADADSEDSRVIRASADRDDETFDSKIAVDDSDDSEMRLAADEQPEKPSASRAGQTPRASGIGAAKKTRPTDTSGLSKPKEKGATRNSLQKELDSIDLELSTMVCEEVTAWSFAEMRRRGEAALDASQTALERGRARVLLSKIGRFEEIKQRHDAISTAQADTDRKNRGLGDAAVALRGQAGPRPDGEGRLMPVVSRKAGAPQYALVDGAGAVTSYLSPGPGVNLRPYIDQQVSVSGQRAFAPDLQKPVINVQRVSGLTQPRRY